MIVTLILFVLILGITVFVHELGHFLFAKLVGIHVYEFSLGFGPCILKKIAKDKTQYSVRAIPLGGFVSLAGEEVNVDREKHKGKNLQDKNVFQRFLVMFMGVGFNFIFAFLVLWLIGIIYGAPNLNPVITEVVPNSAASQAGFEAGDTVLKINDHRITYRDDISIFITIADKEQPIDFEIKKTDGSTEKYSVLLTKTVIDDKPSYSLGVGFGSEKAERGFFKSIVYAFKQECAFFKQMFVVLGNLFSGKLSLKELSGPVGIYSFVGSARSQGLSSILYLIALLSVNVGIVNIIPLPAFDGGRILFLIIEKIKGSPINPKVENIIHSIGFVLLIVLMLYVTFNDILKLF